MLMARFQVGQQTVKTELAQIGIPEKHHPFHAQGKQYDPHTVILKSKFFPLCELLCSSLL